MEIWWSIFSNIEICFSTIPAHFKTMSGLPDCPWTVVGIFAWVFLKAFSYLTWYPLFGVVCVESSSSSWTSEFMLYIKFVKFRTIILKAFLVWSSCLQQDFICISCNKLCSPNPASLLTYFQLFYLSIWNNLYWEAES